MRPVSRPRLLHRLARSSSTVILVTAPAGYGKSTLVSQWIQSLPHRCGWVALSTAINSTSALFRVISQALQIGNGISASSLEDILGQLNRLIETDNAVTLVLDDYHIIESQDVHDAVNGLLDRLPPGLRLVFISRTMPPLRLGRLRMLGYVDELIDRDLRFTDDEVNEVVELTAPIGLTPEQVYDLTRRTEGWIAAIRLILDSIDYASPLTIPDRLDSWIAHRWIDDYIVEEVIQRLSPELRDFVLRTVILTTLEPSLCNEVLGIEHARTLIDDLRRSIVFVRPLDPAGDVLTYHGLFAASLQRIADRQIGESTRQQDRIRAAHWYERHGLVEEAIEHAVAGQDWDIAVRCMLVIGQPLMDADQHYSRLYWLNKLPEAVILQQPHLARWYTSALLYTGYVRKALPLLAQIEPGWEASGDPVQKGYAASTRAFLAVVSGDYREALHHAYVALHHYPLTSHVDRLHVWSAVQGYEFLAGRDEIAEAAYRQARLCREHLPSEQWWWANTVEIEHASQQAIRGNLHTAEALLQERLATLSAQYRSHEAKYLYHLAGIYLEWLQIDRALDLVRRIEDDLATYPVVSWHHDALLVVATVYVAVGDLDRAQHALEVVRVGYDLAGNRRLLEQYEALQASLWLANGKQNMAREWVDHAMTRQFTLSQVVGEPDPNIILASIMVDAHQTNDICTYLAPVIDRARVSKRWADLVYLQIWQAVAMIAGGDEVGALEALHEAIRHGQRGTFLRAFRMPGIDLSPYLTMLRDRLTAEQQAYLDQVMHGIAASRSQEPGRAAIDRLPKLTSREREVLVYLEEGLTNQQIAAKLFISSRTAQKHVNSIIAKMGVSTRTAAVHRARQVAREDPRSLPRPHRERTS